MTMGGNLTYHKWPSFKAVTYSNNHHLGYPFVRFWGVPTFTAKKISHVVIHEGLKFGIPYKKCISPGGDWNPGWGG